MNKVIALAEARPLHNYTGFAVEGQKYRAHRNTNIVDIAKLVREELKTRFPKCKFSVTIERYSGGQSMTVALMEAPFKAITARGRIDRNRQFVDETAEYVNPDYAQINEYVFRGNSDLGLYNNGAVLTPECWDVMSGVCGIVNDYNFNDSDGMIDYFHVNFYSHFAIGKWDKPFKNNSKEA